MSNMKNYCNEKDITSMNFIVVFTVVFIVEIYCRTL